MEIIVEGVERFDQLDRLRRFGGMSVQGFLFSQPVTADDMVTLFASKTLESAAREGTDRMVEWRHG